MLSNSKLIEKTDLGVHLGTRSLLTDLWKNEAPKNAITWYPAQKRLLTLDNISGALTRTDAEQALLKAPKDMLPCLLTYAGGLVFKPNFRQFAQIVHEASVFNPWDAVVQISDKEFEVTPVAFAPLGRRAAVKVAGSIIEAVCPLCPFTEVCGRSVKPHVGNLYDSTLNYYPGIMVDI